jgi:hypothetical protein
MLDLLDHLDFEYNRIHSRGRWETGKNAEIVALTAQPPSLTKSMALHTSSNSANATVAVTPEPPKR